MHIAIYVCSLLVHNYVYAYLHNHNFMCIVCTVIKMLIIINHCRKGDLGEFHKHGSLHQYLLHLHQNGHQPIAMFWWGQQRVVSICSPKMFKDTAKLINKPSKVLATLPYARKFL